MKKTGLIVTLVMLYVTSFAQGTWNIDNAHSNLNFEVGWEDFSVRTGEFKTFEGSIITNAENDLSTALYKLTVDANSIDVIAPNLSEQLKGDQFLAAETYPEITFQSTKAKAISDSTFTITGILKIRGIEKEQEVLLKYKGQKEGRRGDMMGIEVSLKLNKNDFGLEWGAPRLGNVVTVVGHLLYQKRNEEE